MPDMRKFRKYVPFAAIFLGVLGMIFRLTGTVLLQIVVVLLTLILSITAVRNLKPGRSFPVIQRLSAFVLLPLPAALLLAGAGVVQLLGGTWLSAVCSLIAAACIAAMTVLTISGKTPSIFLCLLLTAAVVCRLISDFRVWSVDPMVGDYCFRLFAMICVMCAVFHLGGFCIREGKRRLTAFYCCCGTVFCLMAVADGGLADVLTYGAFALYLPAVLRLLLRSGRRRPSPESI